MAASWVLQKLREAAAARGEPTAAKALPTLLQAPGARSCPAAAPSKHVAQPAGHVAQPAGNAERCRRLRTKKGEAAKKANRERMAAKRKGGAAR